MKGGGTAIQTDIMRPEIEELATWYQGRVGARAALALTSAVAPLIRRGTSTRLLGLGYCAPLLQGFDLASVERLILACLTDQGAGARSEEHTSELQSLMRISYAVFCWKKKD